VELLISHGADINGRPLFERPGQYNATATAIGSETTLSLAIECGDTELACFLTRAGADLSILSKGRTPLLQAICHDHVQIIKCLLEQHVTVNDVRGGISPLAYATCLARHEIFRLLLEGGSDLTSAEPTGEILFDQALELTSEKCSDQEEIFANLSTTEERLRLRPILAEHLKTLEPADLKVLMQTKSGAGAIAMHYAVRWISGQNEGDADLLSLILSKNGNLHAITEAGHNAVMLGLALSNL
jgi:ankyrin repeat protein